MQMSVWSYHTDVCGPDPLNSFLHKDQRQPFRINYLLLSLLSLSLSFNTWTWCGIPVWTWLNVCQWRLLIPETGQSLILFSLLLEDSSPAAPTLSPNLTSEITASPWELWGLARPPEGDTLTPFGRSDTVQVWTWQRHDLIHRPSLFSSWGQRACFACSSWVTKLAWLYR